MTTQNAPDQDGDNDVQVTVVQSKPTDSTTPEGLKLLQDETAALIDAIRKRAQVEAQGAGELAREAYLTAVRQAKVTIEENRVFDPERIDQAVQTLQQEAEKNWSTVKEEIDSFGSRLSEAARVAWETLTATKTKTDDQPPSSD